MKHIILIAVVTFLSISVKAQSNSDLANYPVKDGKLLYEGIIDAPGKTKSDLYINAKQWFVDYFPNANDVIQTDDKSLGRIAGKGSVIMYHSALMSTVKWHETMTIQVDYKDGKYRYRIYDMTVYVPKVDLGGSYGELPAYNFTDSDLVGKIMGTEKDAPLTKNQSKKALEAIDEQTKETIASLMTAMGAKADTF